MGNSSQTININCKVKSLWTEDNALCLKVPVEASPYPTIPPQNLYKLLKEGYRMSKPENCSDELYYLMRQCWRPYPRERPSFKFLVSKLDMLLQDTVEYMDLTSRMKPGRRRSRDSVAPTTGPIPTVQYTSVLVEDDEEQHHDPELCESFGLARLFNQHYSSSPKPHALHSTTEMFTVA
ncbi:fibroblast growth factor receptor 2 [Caerostris darwini]|uniref:Fibroblast growth factor receptor 2 n=1 Tax=Caerostris darwini TaxID=1538125 RepID=A0AAV4W147_9ARAC|nr:fibroblast growth factor receptor 2 [Caerostris darwini]